MADEPEKNLDPQDEPSPKEDDDDKDLESPDPEDDLPPKEDDEPGEPKEPQEEFDEEKYLAEFDLPEEPKTVDDALAAYKTLVAAQTIQKIEKVEPPKEEEPVKAEGFSETPFSDFVKDMDFGDDNNKKSYEFLAKSVDGAYGPVFKLINENMNTFTGVAELLVAHVREQSWQTFEHKGRVDRKKLTEAMRKHGLLNYSDALRQVAIKDGDPNLLKLLVPSSDDGKKGSRFTSMRRGKKQTAGKSAAAGYLTPDGELDREKLGKLPSEQAHKIAQAFIKEQTKQE